MHSCIYQYTKLSERSSALAISHVKCLAISMNERMRVAHGMDGKILSEPHQCVSLRE